MTVRPYIYGTALNGSMASVANGSDIVTGAVIAGHATAWTGISFGDYFSVRGLMVPILQIVDDSHLQLAYVWPGTSSSIPEAYAITAGIDPTDARRFGWLVSQYYLNLQQIPADTQQFRDQAAASAAASAASAVTAQNYSTLSQGWSSTAKNVDVPGATAGSRSALHYSAIAADNAALASSNGAAQVALAAAQVTLAAAWASTPYAVQVPGAPAGSFSALSWATQAQGYANVATSNGAAQVALAAAQVVIAQKWSSNPDGADVTTPGTRSAMHWADAAQITYNNTVGVFNQTAGVLTQVQGGIATAASYAQLAADWAQKGDGLDVNGAGTRSAKAWANAAASSASAGQGFRDSAQGYAASAAASAAILANPDFGSITSSVTVNADYGSVP